MQIFVVAACASEAAYAIAKKIVREAGAMNYSDAEEFFPDGVQDPYRAVDEADAIVWVYSEQALSGMLLGMGDYNYLYADTVMQRAVRTGKPILYYYLKRTDFAVPIPAIMQGVTRRMVVHDLPELEAQLRSSLCDLIEGRIPLSPRQSMPSIFLSYAHIDKPFARQLKNDLERGGARVWLDDGEIQIGDSLIETIRSAIDETDYFGVILSPASVKSHWVRKELDVAMNQEIDGQEVKVLPLIYRHCEIPGFLKGKLYADFSTNYNDALFRVLRRLGLQDSGHVSA